MYKSVPYYDIVVLHVMQSFLDLVLYIMQRVFDLVLGLL